MRLTEIALPGCYEIQTNPLEDLRGRFVKVFHKEIFANLGLEINFAEEYYSVSYHRVLRGLHFQVPPHEHLKLVYCVEGRVLDVVVDLRVGSPQYGKFATIELSRPKGQYAVYCPRSGARVLCFNGKSNHDLQGNQRVFRRTRYGHSLELGGNSLAGPTTNHLPSGPWLRHPV